MEIVLSKSHRASKKYAVRAGSTTVHFGASGYEDFTMHKDEKRKARYLARHKRELERSNYGCILVTMALVGQTNDCRICAGLEE